DTIEKYLERTSLAIIIIVALWGVLFLPGLRQNGLWDPWEMDRAFLGRELVGPARILVVEKSNATASITATLRKVAGARKITVRGPKDYLTGARTPNLVTALGESDRTLYDAIVVDLGLVFPTRSEGEKLDAWIRRLAAPMRQLDRLSARNPQAAIVVTSTNAQHDFKSLVEDMARARIFNAHQFLRYNIKFWEDHLSAGLPVPEPPLDAISLANFPVLYTVWHRPSDEAPAAKVVENALTRSRFRVSFKSGGETYAVPVLNAYLIALSYRLWGTTEAAARAPFAAFGLIGLLLVFFWIRAVRSPRAGLFAVIVLATLPHYFFQGKTAAGDLPFIVSLTALIASYSLLLHRGEILRRYLITFGLAAILVFAAEGITGLLLAVAIVAGNVLVARDFRQVSLAPLYGLAAFFGVMATLVWISDWSYFTHFRMTVQLFSNGPNTSHRYFDYFIQQVGFAALPWSALFPFALGGLFVRLRGESAPGEDPKRSLALLMLLWFGFGYLLFSVTLKEMGHFVFPAIVAAAVACGVFLDELWESGERNVLIGVIFLLAAGILLKEIRNTPGSILGPIAYDPPFQIPGDPATSSHPLFPETLKFSSLAKYTLLAMAVGAFLYFSQVLVFLRKLSATRIALGLAIVGYFLHATVSGAVEYNSNFDLYRNHGGRNLDASFLDRVFAYSEILLGYTLAFVLLMATLFHRYLKRVLGWFNRARLQIGLLIFAILALGAAAVLLNVSAADLLQQLRAQTSGAPQVGRLVATAVLSFWILGGIGLVLGLCADQLGLLQLPAIERLGLRLADARPKLVVTLAFLVAAAAFSFAGNALHVFLSVARRISVDASGVPVDGTVAATFGVSVVNGFSGYFRTWQFGVSALLIGTGAIFLWLRARGGKKTSGIDRSTVIIVSVCALIAAILMTVKGFSFSRAYIAILLEEGSGNLTRAQMWRDVLFSPFLLTLYALIALTLYLGLHSLVARQIERTRSWRRTSSSTGTLRLGLSLTALGTLLVCIGSAIAHTAYYQLLNHPRALAFSPVGNLLRRADTWIALLAVIAPAILWFFSDRSTLAKRLLGENPARRAGWWLGVGGALFLFYFIGNLAFEYRDVLVSSKIGGVVPGWVATTLQIYSAPTLIFVAIGALFGLGALRPDLVERIAKEGRWWHIWYAFVVVFSLVSLDAIVSLAMGVKDSMIAVNEVSRKGVAESAWTFRLGPLLKVFLVGSRYLGAVLIAGLLGVLLNRVWPHRGGKPSVGGEPKGASTGWIANLNPFALFESKRVAASMLMLGAVAFCLPLATSFSKKLSYNLSQKHILETYRRSAGTNEIKGKLFKYGTFSLGSADRNFYTADIPSVTLDATIRGLSSDDRKYYIVSRRDFSRLNYDFRSRKNGEFLKVLDERSFAYVLVSNQLKSDEPDRNWIAKAVIRVPETLPTTNLHSFVGQTVRPLLPTARFHPGYGEFGIEASKTRQWSELRRQGISASQLVPAIVFLGYQSPADVVSSGQKFKIKMYFLSVNQPYGSYKIFMHVDRIGGGRLHFDHWVLNLSSANDAKCIGCFETRHWMPGDIAIDTFERTIPIGTDGGTRHMQMGFYLEKGPRLKIIRSGDGISHGRDNRLNIGTMTIR
ncbi:MAG: glycosyltransferase family 39 protein, partial [Myxococcales bacterium]|nr:glycosyltransferase family 39 protein [Myxococcales bacterium]